MKPFVRFWALLAFVSCRAAFDPEHPRAYLCESADAAANECPGGWVCSLTAGFCINPDAGLSLPCKSDFECGGGWKCSPHGQCVNRPIEGTLTVLNPVSDAQLRSPLFPSTGALHASEAVTLQKTADEFRIGQDLWFDAPTPLWLMMEVEVSPTDATARYRALPVAQPGRSPVISTGAQSGEITHTWWSLTDAGLWARPAHLSDLSLDVGTVEPGVTEYLSSARVASGSVKSNDATWWGGGVLVRERIGPATLYITRNSKPFALPLRVPRSIDNVALADAPCGRFIIGAGPGKLYIDDALDAGAPPEDAGTTGDLRIAKHDESVSVAWLNADGTITYRDLCSTDTPNTVIACPNLPDGGIRTLVSWALSENANGVLVPRRVCEGAKQQAIFEGSSLMVRDFVYDPITTTSEASGVWVRTANANSLSLVQSSGIAADVSLAHPPDALLRLNGTVVGTRPDGIFAEVPSMGFMRFNSTVVSAANVATSDGRFFVRRNGVVATETWGVAFAATPWAEPAAPVLLRTVPSSDGGVMLFLTHDDTIDVADLKVATKEAVPLAPTIIPAPGFAVTDLTIRRSTDGGFANGYAIAGGSLVELNATAPTHWQASKVDLTQNALHVWFDAELPRVVLSDGSIVGLTAVVALTSPTPAPAIAAVTRCNSPFVLTDDGVFQLGADAGWRKVGGASSPTGFAGGRLLTLDAGVYAFDKAGHAYSFDVVCP